MSSYYSRKNTETKCGRGEAPPIIYTLLAGGGGGGGGAFLSPVLRCPARPDGNRGALSRIVAFTSLPVRVCTFFRAARETLYSTPPPPLPPGAENGKLCLNVRVCVVAIHG